MQVKNLSQSQVIRNSFWKFCESMGVQILMLVITIILARILTPQDYGMMAIIVIATNFLTLFVNSSISSYLVYVSDIRKQDFLTAIVCNVLVAFALVAILIISAPQIATFYSAPSLTPMIRTMSVIIPFSSVSSVYNAYAMKMSLFKTLFLRNIISGPVSGILALWMAYSGFGVWALVSQQLCYNILLCIIVVFTIKIDIDGDWRLDFISLKKMWSYGSFTLLSTMIGFVSDSISDLVIGKRINSAKLGIYSRGIQFPNSLFNSINSVISGVFFPAFASYGHDITLLKEKCRKSIRVVYSFVLPLLFGLIVCASPLINLLLTAKWEESIPIVQIVCCYFMAVPFLQMTSQALLAVGSVKIRMVGEIVKMAATFIFLFYMIRYGINGVAISRVLVGVTMVLFTVTITNHIMGYGLVELISDLSKPLVSSIIMGICVFPFILLNLGQLNILIIQICLGAAVYIVVSKVLRNNELFDLISRIIGKITHRQLP